ncbi:29161_t:CDS:2, partial [Gigaspora margarita]
RFKEKIDSQKKDNSVDEVESEVIRERQSALELSTKQVFESKIISY